MRYLLAVLLLVLGSCRGAVGEPSLPPAPVTHVVLLDVSGSLRSRHYARCDASGRARWTPAVPTLVRTLLAPGGAFRPTDRVLLVPFSDEVTDVRLGRREAGPFELAQEQGIDAAMAAMVIDGATNMPRALERGLMMARRCAPAVIWMITDNENNLGGSRTDDDFYRALRDDPAIGHVSVFPMGKAEGDSLVLYLVVPRGATEPLAEAFSEMVATRTGVGTVLFRPIVATADEGQLSVSSDVQLYIDGVPAADDRVTQEAGTTRLHFDEGDDLHGQLRFRIHSNLLHWKIVNATIRVAHVGLAIPVPFSGGDEPVEVGAQVQPRVLTVDPQGTSAQTYLVDLESLDPPAPSPVRLARGGIERVLRAELPNIRGSIVLAVDVTLDPTGASTMQPAVDAATLQRMKRVPQLDQITRFMIFHADPTAKTKDFSLDMQRQIVIEVESRGIPAWPVVGVAGVGALGLAGWGWVWARPRPFHLSGPDVDANLDVGPFKTAPVVAGGAMVGTLARGLRGLVFRPTVGEPQRLELHDGSYAFEVGDDGAIHRYTISPIETGMPAGQEEEGTYL